MKNDLEVEVFEAEVCLDDASGLHSGPQHILLRRQVVWLPNPVQIVQEVLGTVVQLVLIRARETHLRNKVTR